MGTKEAHIGSGGEMYPRDHVVMIGDAPGDLRAAQAHGVLFYLIIPGQEEASWNDLVEGALDRFFDGTYRGAYQETLLERFDRALPEFAPWEER